MTTEATEEDLITEYIPLESLETEYLVNSGNLYQPEHNEHDYISTVLVENVHEEIVSSTCCDESSIMKTEKCSDDELSNTSNFHDIIVTSSNAHSSESVVTPRDTISPSKSKTSSQIPANIIFSDKTLNTIVLAPSTCASNTSVRISRLPMSQNKTPPTKTTVSPASPNKSTPMKTIVSGSKNSSHSSNIPGLSYALYPNTSVSNTASVSSALRGSRTSSILCSSVSSISSPKQHALCTLTSPSTCSPIKKIILQKPTKQLGKNVNPPTSIPTGAYVEIHSSPPPLAKIVTSSSSLSSQSSSATSSSSISRSVVSANSSQTIVIYTSPSANHPVSTSSTSKNLMKTSTISCTANNALALRPSSASMVTVARTIVIGTTSSHQTSCSNTISSTVRSTNANSSLRPASSHNGGNTRAINISKHVATNTVRHISQRSIGVNTQQPLSMQSLGPNTPLRDIKPMKVALGIDVTGRKVLLHKPVVRTTPGQLPASSTSAQVMDPSAEFFKILDVASCATKVSLKRPRDVSPPTLSPTDDIGDHLSFDHPAFRSDKRERVNSDNAIMEPKRKINLVSNYEEQIGGSCPSSTNKELQAAVVVGEDAQPLTSSEGEFVHSEIVKQLKKTLEAPDSPELRFLNSGMVESGWYMCTCQDSTSLDWLLSLEPMQFIEGRSLRVVRATELPWPSQVGFQIQGKDIDPESVLSLLQRQNKKLKTKKWNILEKREESNSAFLSYFIDPDSVQALEEYQWILCYELSTIHVHLLKGTVGIHWKEIKDETITPENGIETY